MNGTQTRWESRFASVAGQLAQESNLCPKSKEVLIGFCIHPMFQSCPGRAYEKACQVAGVTGISVKNFQIRVDCKRVIEKANELTGAVLNIKEIDIDAPSLLDGAVIRPIPGVFADPILTELIQRRSEQNV